RSRRISYTYYRILIKSPCPLSGVRARLRFSLFSQVAYNYIPSRSTNKTVHYGLLFILPPRLAARWAAAQIKDLVAANQPLLRVRRERINN
ncbi:hypothetical protein ABRP93_02065, partial [Corynebacterium sp. KPL2850]|uniref:hypothetical protein n=1 Tax=Corynebacterium sp. KPL2850 TaxID=3158318 RepID=UPI0032F0230A